MSPRRSAVAPRRRVGLGDEVGDMHALSRASGAQDRRRSSVARWASVWFCVGEDLQDLVGLLERRVGAPDDRRCSSAPRPARPVPSSLMMIDSRWRYGQPHDVADQVEVDRLGVVLRAGSRYWPLPGPSLDLLAAAGAGGCPAGRGCVGVHSTNFSPISDCGRIVQLASLRKSWKPGSVMFRTTAALWSGVTSSDSIVPTLTPAILTSSPGMTRRRCRRSRGPCSSPLPSLAGARAEEHEHERAGGAASDQRRWRARASWAGQHEARVAVASRLGVGVRAPSRRRRLGGGARAAA